MRRERSETLAVIGHQGTRGGAAEAVRLLQDRLEHRPRVARRTVDSVQHLGQRRLPRQRRVALGAALVEFAPEIGDLVVEDHGHLLTPLRPGPSRPTRTDYSPNRLGRAWPGHPRTVAHALPVSVDARHKAGQDDYAETESSECVWSQQHAAFDFPQRPPSDEKGC